MTVNVQSWESEAALTDYLKSAQSRTVIIGLTAEAPRAYYSLSADLGETRVEVGVVSSGLGTEAAGTLLRNGRLLVVGHDKALTWIDLERIVEGPSLSLDGVFYEFLGLGSEDEVLVIHELGALRVSASGAVLWSIDTDIVQNVNLDAGVLELTSIEGDRSQIVVASGNRLSR